MDNVAQKQMYYYLKPLMTGANMEVYKRIDLSSYDLTKDCVFIGSKNFSKETFIKVLLSMKGEVSYKILPLSRLTTINRHEDEEISSLTALVDTKVLFIVSGEVDQVGYIGNVIDVVVDSRRIAGLKTYIFHTGTMKEFQEYKSSYMNNFVPVNPSIGVKKGGKL